MLRFEADGGVRAELVALPGSCFQILRGVYLDAGLVRLNGQCDATFRRIYGCHIKHRARQCCVVTLDDKIGVVTVDDFDLVIITTGAVSGSDITATFKVRPDFLGGGEIEGSRCTVNLNRAFFAGRKLISSDGCNEVRVQCKVVIENIFGAEIEIRMIRHTQDGVQLLVHVFGVVMDFYGIVVVEGERHVNLLCISQFDFF